MKTFLEVTAGLFLILMDLLKIPIKAFGYIMLSIEKQYFTLRIALFILVIGFALLYLFGWMTFIIISLIIGAISAIISFAAFTGGDNEKGKPTFMLFLLIVLTLYTVRYVNINSDRETKTEFVKTAKIYDNHADGFRIDGSLINLTKITEYNETDGKHKFVIVDIINTKRTNLDYPWFDYPEYLEIDMEKYKKDTEGLR